eukprot:EG_transcript_22118
MPPPPASALVAAVQQRMKEQFASSEGSHDWHHVQRVWRLACRLQEAEGGDRAVVELAALLHDISDHKLNGGRLDAGGHAAAELLVSLGADAALAQRVAAVVDSVSFKGAHVPDTAVTLEAQVVQDADRLDAMGAIGIARTFAYGGSRNRPLYDPDVPPQLHSSFQEYAKSQSPTINHFHEKLLLLQGRLHTPTARLIGAQRHAFMERFLTEFHREWELEDCSSAEGNVLDAPSGSP